MKLLKLLIAICLIASLGLLVLAFKESEQVQVEQVHLLSAVDTGAVDERKKQFIVEEVNEKETIEVDPVVEPKKEVKKVIPKPQIEETPQSKIYNVHHNGYANDSIVQTYVDYAFMISDYDQDFVLMLNQENGRWDMHRQADHVYSNGYRENSWGFCMINFDYNPEYKNDKRFFEDRKYQLGKCLEEYRKGTTFYGYRVRHLSRRYFSFR